MKKILIGCLVWTSLVVMVQAAEPSRVLKVICFERRGEAAMLTDLGFEGRHEILKYWNAARSLAQDPQEIQRWTTKIDRETFLVSEVDRGQTPDQIQAACLAVGH